MTDDEIRRFIIADNVEMGEHDWDMLANEWDADELADWGLDVPGFVGGGAGEAQEDDYEIPDEIETDIIVGDLFEIGPHRLLCGDSTKAEDVERLMNGEKADMVFTDPDFSMPFDALAICYENTKKHSKGFGFWICGDKQAVYLASNDFENFAHFYVHDFRIPNLISNSRSMQRHTLIAKFGSKGINNLHDGFSTIVGVATDRKGREVAPMAKKIELPFAFIQHYSNEGETILDVFAHSGSTAVAAGQLNRMCYMLEIEPKYCQCILNRMIADNPDIKITKNGKEYLHNTLEANNLQPLTN
jgi:DNA modification methylase